MKAIENRFEDFLNYDYLSQSDTDSNNYFNEKYRIWFFHDFDKYHSLEEQLPNVREKYLRRIKRFYEAIKQPTLFVRYISDEVVNEDGKSMELEYIEKNNEYIMSLLKSFNEENNVIYIANGGVTSDIIKIYNVEKDENDGVARKPLDKNNELRNLLMSFDYKLREKNLEIFNKKHKCKGNIFLKVYKKLHVYFEEKLFSEYIHDKIISHTIK